MALITISPDFRTIQVPTGLILAVEGDQNVLTVNFTMARYYNGIDLSEYALKINYINAGGCGDIYLITDPEVQEEQILFNWTIGQNAAAYRGRLTFALEATKTDEAGTVTNELHTMPASIRVPATVDVCTGATETALSDLLAQLMKITGEAQESATEAARSATRAARSEEQAGEYADRAEASAYNAGLAKEQAQAARTGAEAAQTAAESARTAASNSSTRAANSATAAAGSAQEAADSRTEAAAYINELTGEKLSGDTVSYTAEAALPIEDLTIDIQGSQDLNGYRSPWVGGAGKNKLKVTATTQTINGVTFTVNSDGSVYVSGTGTAVANFTLYQGTVPSGDYILSGNISGSQIDLWKSGGGSVYDNGAGVAFTSDGETSYIFRITTSANITYDITISPMIRLATVADSTYEPYENIAPITAYTGRTITQQGKNLLPNSDSATIINAYLNNNNILAASAPDRTVIMPCEANTVYTFTWNKVPIAGQAGDNYSIASFTDLPVIGSVGTRIAYEATATNLTFQTASDARYLAIKISNVARTEYPKTLNDSMLEEGDTATEYEPYQHAETVVSWETEAGEVYKGTLNINTGELVVEEVEIEVNPDWYNWSKSGSYPGGFYVGINPNNIPLKTYTPLSVCSHRSIASTINEYVLGTAFVDSSLNFRWMSAAATLQDWKDYITAQANAGTPITIAGELATPRTYQLTPQEVRNLIGRQTLSSNTGAIVNAWIRTGEETYIDKVNEAQSEAIEELQTAVDTLQGGLLVKYVDVTVDSTTGYQFRIKEKFPEIQTLGIIGARVMFANGNRGSSRSSAYLFCSLTNTYNTDYTYLRICIAGSYTQVTAGTYIVRIYYFE